MTLKFTNGRVSDVPRKVLKGETSPFLKLLFEVIHKKIWPRDEHHHEVTFHDMGIDHAIDL